MKKKLVVALVVISSLAMGGFFDGHIAQASNPSEEGGQIHGQCSVSQWGAQRSHEGHLDTCRYYGYYLFYWMAS